MRYKDPNLERIESGQGLPPLYNPPPMPVCKPARSSEPTIEEIARVTSWMLRMREAFTDDQKPNFCPHCGSKLSKD